MNEKMQTFAPTTKRTPGDRRVYATNWGVINDDGQWACAFGAPAVFNTKRGAQAWIDDPASFGKDALTWRTIPDDKWLGQTSAEEPSGVPHPR